MKETRFIDGFSESAWKSLVVKSVRIGWPTGIEEASKRLAKSTVKACLLCGIFEDTFPAPGDLAQVVEQINAGRWDLLCAWDTHHSREGLTAKFCALKEQAIDAAQTKQSELYAEATKLKLWLPPRSLNCFWTWLRIAPDLPARRMADRTPWTGMPAAMLDGHTYEGRIRRTRVTLLSGHYENHLALSKLVQVQGWTEVRRMAHAEIVGSSERPRYAQQNFLF